MNKINIILFASICAFAFYVLVFDKTTVTKKKFDEEVLQVIKEINNGKFGNDSTKK